MNSTIPGSASGGTGGQFALSSHREGGVNALNSSLSNSMSPSPNMMIDVRESL
jgi:hypothetical protein